METKQNASARIARKDFVKRPRASVLSIVPELFRLVFQAFWILMFHHFISNTIISPFIFKLVRDDSFAPRIYNFLHSNSAVLWVQENIFASFLAKRDNNFDDVLMFVIGTTVVHLLAYVLINGFFAVLDIYGLLQQFRIPMQPRMKITRELITQTLSMIVRTIFISSPLGLGFLFLLSKWKPTLTEEDMTSWSQPIHVQLFQFWFCIMFNHFFFYWAHRLFHEVPFAYRIFHSQHHQYVNSISISAEHAHPIEQVLANFMPTYGGILILTGYNIPMSMWFTWLFCRLWETFEAHSGFDFRGTFLHQIGILVGQAHWHGYHHSNYLPTFSSCYGQYYLDWIFGTDEAWLMDPNLPHAPCQSTELDW